MRRIFIAAFCVMASAVGARVELKPVFEKGNPDVENLTDNIAYIDNFQSLYDPLNGESWEVVICDRKADVLWSVCRRWMAETIPNYERMKILEDKSEGVLITHVATKLQAEGKKDQFYSKWTGTHNWTLTIECKDGRLRMKFQNYYAYWSVQGYSKNVGWMRPLPYEKLYYESAERLMGEDLFFDCYEDSLWDLKEKIVNYISQTLSVSDDF